MSADHARLFLRKLVEDRSFKARIQHAPGDEGRARIAKEEGFDLTQAELDDAVRQASSRKLPEEHLDAVSGGTASSDQSQWDLPHISLGDTSPGG
jgi:predicted ribosomally synthesized peptide with nif11-like leader